MPPKTLEIGVWSPLKSQLPQKGFPCRSRWHSGAQGCVLGPLCATKGHQSASGAVPPSGSDTSPHCLVASPNWDVKRVTLAQGSGFHSRHRQGGLCAEPPAPKGTQESSALPSSRGLGADLSASGFRQRGEPQRWGCNARGWESTAPPVGSSRCREALRAARRKKPLPGQHFWGQTAANPSLCPHLEHH